jgi:predicted DNA-binding transcriptional regulator YafY
MLAVQALIALAFLTALYLWFRRDHKYPAGPRVAIIRSALANKNDIKMEYFTYRSRRFSVKRITPLELGEGEIYLKGYDHFRLAERTYKVSRIKSLEEVEGKKKDQ